jgi:hypothetical protein
LSILRNGREAERPLGAYVDCEAAEACMLECREENRWVGERGLEGDIVEKITLVVVLLASLCGKHELKD